LGANVKRQIRRNDWRVQFHLVVLNYDRQLLAQKGTKRDWVITSTVPFIISLVIMHIPVLLTQPETAISWCWNSLK
jgi:hypothetical protein